MKQNPLLILLFFVFPFISFGQLDVIYGEYYALEEEKGVFVLNENCWSMQLDMLIIQAENDVEGYQHSLMFNSFHAESYLVYEVQHGHNVTYLSAHLEDAPEKEVHTFEIRFIEDRLSVTHQNYESTVHYVAEKDKSSYPFVPCSEEDEFEIEDDSNLDLQAAILEFMDPLFTGEEIAFDKFVGKDGFDFIYPGSGLYFVQSKLLNASAVYANEYYQQFVNSAPDGTWAQLPFTFDEHLPHLCTEDDVKRGVYVSVHDFFNVQIIDILIFVKDGAGDSNGMLIQLVLDEDGQLEVRSIKINECAA